MVYIEAFVVCCAGIVMGFSLYQICKSSQGELRKLQEMTESMFSPTDNVHSMPPFQCEVSYNMPNPMDANVYADWLEENGEFQAAEKLRRAFPISKNKDNEK